MYFVNINLIYSFFDNNNYKNKYEYCLDENK